ncbi:MAG: beta-glucosidase, partial [Oscillospiraceae bacterium]|nr:beta-glucosidase [Oscillospiraceae bacterium]
DGLMAPAMNIHRTPFSGRNFEYYSEDGYISGMIGASYVQGMNSNGVITFVKHFALNDEETYRYGICVWANEQSMRELYFKPFELTVKLGETRGIMSSFNRLGTTWAGGSYALLNNVLRDEWGFCGTVISDMANVYLHMEADVAIRAGNDLMLAPTSRMPTDLTANSNTGHQALREASHNILYTIVNSCALDVLDVQQTHPWYLIVIGVDAVVLVLAAVGFRSMGGKKKKAAAKEA